MATERLTWAGEAPDLAVYYVYYVEKHSVGWAVFWNSAEYALTRDWRHCLIGSGPYLVDLQDGSIHHIP
ncbi:hypothetical protein GCM10009639_26950 [Kitasatospora putterlickiae]|uniref:Immunity protein 35 domain-containing protein n=1 Tax=Kitasatospora putterlickiae TaxID=221725 RepID=A0ABN1Y416_9ACTN